MIAARKSTLDTQRTLRQRRAFSHSRIIFSVQSGIIALRTLCVIAFQWSLYRISYTGRYYRLLLCIMVDNRLSSSNETMSIPQISAKMHSHTRAIGTFAHKYTYFIYIWSIGRFRRARQRSANRQCRSISIRHPQRNVCHMWPVILAIWIIYEITRACDQSLRNIRETYFFTEHWFRRSMEK